MMRCKCKLLKILTANVRKPIKLNKKQMKRNAKPRKLRKTLKEHGKKVPMRKK